MLTKSSEKEIRRLCENAERNNKGFFLFVIMDIRESDTTTR